MKNFFTIAIIAFSLNAFAQTISNGIAINFPFEREVSTLTVTPSAQPEVVCQGDEVHLFSVPDGGSSNYSYNWRSDPPGFVSDAAEPVVNPEVTTVYTVEVTDGTNITSGTVMVTVKPLPLIELIPLNDPDIEIISPTEINICVFDSVMLNAGNPGCTYAWNNGSTTQKLCVLTSGMSCDMQEYAVTVTDPVTRCSNDSKIKINFTFTNCTYGIIEKQQLNLSVFPNPSTDGVFNLSIDNAYREVKIEIYSSIGTLIQESVVKVSSSNSLKTTIDLNTQPNGIYFLKVKNSETTTVQKLLVRH